MEQTVIREGKTLKYGYTTGTCAAGAAAAAVRILETDRMPEQVTVVTPKGWHVDLTVLNPTKGEGWAEAAVRKDAGDDPDVTHEQLIVVRVSRNTEGTVRYYAGEGVGTVTKAGLQIPVGEPAINPVPRRMIEAALADYVQTGRGYDVTVSVPGGEALAQKTFNPRLGIVGGISIIGTSGIVEPMSEEALKESLAVDLGVKRAQGLDRIVLTPGNYGRELGQTLKIPEAVVVKTSNFAGFMLDRAAEQGFTEILWVGHLGKLAKVAGGIFHTHSSIADGRLEVIAAWAGASGADRSVIQRLLESNTTEEAVAELETAGMLSLCDTLARRVSLRSEERAKGRLRVGTILFTLEKGVVGMDAAGRAMLKELTDEEAN